MKNIRLIFLVVMIAGQYNFFGQTTGYLGKKFILKTNLINGRFLGINNLDVEYVVGRKLALTAGFQTFKYGRSDNGRNVKTGVMQPMNGKNKYREISNLSGGETKGWILSAGIRSYFDRILPAPLGYYIEATIGFGSASFSGYNVSYSYKDAGYNVVTTDYYARKNITNLSGSSKILFFEVPSLGYQKIIKRIICLDAKISLQGQYCNLPDEMLNALEHNYYTRSNAVSFGYNGLSLGLAAYLKIGLLLF